MYSPGLVGVVVIGEGSKSWRMAVSRIVHKAFEYKFKYTCLT